MNRSNSNWWIWLILLMILSGGLTGLFPLFVIIAVVLGVTGASVNAYKNNANLNTGRSFTRNGSYQRTSTSQSSKLAQINNYLRKYFNTRNSVFVSENVELRVRDGKFVSLGSLDVYRNNTFICSFNDYQRRYPESYTSAINQLYSLAKNNPIQDDVIDAEVVESNNTQTAQQSQQTQAPKEKNAQYYIDEINALNNDIPDEKITNGLYETTSLLKQIQTLEVKFPNSKDKLEKLYEYYLPILTKILKQYESLQYAKTDPSYEETKNKLTKTIDLINDAMEKIISSMTDQDFINLSADISTLEAVLKKDGLTDEDTMSASKTSGENQ